MKNPHIEWVEVEEQLPIIPEDKYGVSVLVATFDPNYAEWHDDLFTGYDISEVTYGVIIEEDKYRFPKNKEYDFQVLYHGTQVVRDSWGPTGDPVTHWRYLPQKPTELPKWYLERKKNGE